MTPLDRLLLEAIPVRPPKPPVPPWTPEEQARHLADLMEALDGWQSDEPSAVRKRTRHRQLRLDTSTERPAA